ncbi:MAG: sulfur reduction protein DsrE [Alcaligenaceae bacterium]|jgi:predicted peroxiredoxin|nr:sulfur reduction protein DsrE [Alcaligenaceae bacterium]
MQTADFVTTIFDGHSNPNKVTVAFTMALSAVKKGHSATVILMGEAVQLAKPDAANDIDIGQPFEPAATLIKNYLELGGQIAICKSCMVHNGISEEEVVPSYQIITSPDVIDLLMASKGSLQLT